MYRDPSHLDYERSVSVDPGPGDHDVIRGSLRVLPEMKMIVSSVYSKSRLGEDRQDAKKSQS